MSTVTLSESIKVRVNPEWKTRLKEHADAENLDISDIARRAIFEFIGRTKRRKTFGASRRAAK